MLGVPVISVVGKTNADLVLPTELLLPREVSASRAAAFVNRTVSWFDARPHEYRKLSARVRASAVTQFTPPDRAALVEKMSACC